ncbi:hypothetical protein N7535_000135 [Penicillium sp. DV-2018c]|nr:hypothetical protein N7461_006621 [Penicillium sp. DV-2018c]KAJ5581515.1 hypothetical protein N7535_000135 [Penicillium sp. DV-2018c]
MPNIVSLLQGMTDSSKFQILLVMTSHDLGWPEQIGDKAEPVRAQPETTPENLSLTDCSPTPENRT